MPKENRWDTEPGWRVLATLYISIASTVSCLQNKINKMQMYFKCNLKAQNWEKNTRHKFHYFSTSWFLDHIYETISRIRIAGEIPDIPLKNQLSKLRLQEWVDWRYSTVARPFHITSWSWTFPAKGMIFLPHHILCHCRTSFLGAAQNPGLEFNFSGCSCVYFSAVSDPAAFGSSVYSRVTQGQNPPWRLWKIVGRYVRW